jgi:hypothetical protein
VALRTLYEHEGVLPLSDNPIKLFRPAVDLAKLLKY